MSNIDPDLAPEPEAEDQQGIRALRAEAKAGKAAMAEAAAAKRELAFLKAGVPDDSKAADLFRKTYDGDLADVGSEWTAFKAELGIGEAPSPASDPDPQPDPAAQIAATHAQLASGPAGSRIVPPETDKLQEGYDHFHDKLKTGMSREDASVDVFGAIMEQAYGGKDERLLLITVPGGGQMSIADAKMRGLIPS